MCARLNGSGWSTVGESSKVRNVLAIDTATDTVVAGIARIDRAAANGVEVLVERAIADGRRHAEITTTLIVDCLAESGVARDDLAAVVVGTGPGPFTGLRVGMATGAGFGDALGIPVFGVCSLDAIAIDAHRAAELDDGADATTLVVTDARRREVYWGLYRGGERISGPTVCAPGAVADELATAGISLESVTVVGGSASHLQLVGWSGTEPTITVPSVVGLVRAASQELLAGATPGPLTPLYLRRPDAVERKTAASAVRS